MDLYKYKYPIIFFTFILTILFGFQIKNITVFHDIDKFVPKNRDDLKFLKEFNLALEPDDSYYLVALENSGKSIFDSTFLSKTHALTHELKGLENITKAVSITSVNTPLKTPFTGMVMTSLLAFDQPSKYHSDSIRIANDERVYGLLVSKDFKSLLIYLKTKNNLTQLPSKQLDQDIKTIVQKYRFSETHYAGKSNVQSEFEKLIQKEIKFNIILSLSVLLVILVLVFRKFWAVVVALLSVVIGAVIFIGFLGYLGKPLNLMSMLFPPLMFIVGISDVVHFFTNFSKNISEGLPTRLAMKKTINEIGWATLLTSLTTSVGFASLIFSQIEPIKDFGWTAAIGVFIAYLVVIFFTSSIMLVIPTKWLIVDHKDGEDFWNKLMKNIFFLVINNKKKITIITSIVVAISIVGTLNISTNAYLLSDVPTNSSLMKDVSFFEKNYSGIRNYEVAVVPTGNNKINDFKVLKEIDKLEKHLATYKIAGISSPATIYKSLNKASKGNKKDAYTIPDNPNFIKQYRKMTSQYENRNINKVVNADMNMGRITGLMIDIGSDNVRKQNEAIK